MREAILQALDDGMRAIENMKGEVFFDFIEQAAEIIATCFRSQKKLLICGNGGSLCDAMHFAEELAGFYRGHRKALPAIALADSGLLSCVGNDVGFDQVFSRGVEAYGQAGDVLVVLTTSGNSMNLVHAVKAAKERGLITIGFLGKTGGKLKGQTDLEWTLSGFLWSDRIQEAHMMAIHILIDQVETLLFNPQYATTKV